MSLRRRSHPFVSCALACASLLLAARTARAGTLFVDANLASGANNGSSWADAFQGVAGLANALAVSAGGDQIWVVQGTYKPTATLTRTVFFELKSGVEIYGGFAGGETSLAQRDFTTNTAILSGDLAGDDASSIFTDNSIHVVRGNGADATAVLDGFTIRGGNANGSSTGDNDRGGGLLMVAASNATVRNCIVKENRCVFGGGAAYVRQSSPSFTDTRFENNFGASFGGAFDMFDTVGSVFNRCTFSGNSAARSGGVEIFGNCSTKLYDCLFTGNTSTGTGGGGAIFVANGSTPQIRNCTVVANTSTINAAAGILQSSSTSSIGNSIFYFNSGPSGAQGSINQVSGAAATYSCVQGGLAGAGNVSGDPHFVNIAGGDFRVVSGSPCIDSGNDALVPAVLTLDFAGNPRIEDDPNTIDTGIQPAPIVDMGIFEVPNTLYTSLCFGDGTTAIACPCNNFGGPRHGCLNSDFFSNGGLLTVTGTSNPDTVVLTASEVKPSALCIFLQGDASNPAGVVFGDGLLCTSGTLKHLKSTPAAAGIASYPQGADLPITQRSTMVGDPIAPGSIRYYQVYYRDVDMNFCAPPSGNAWNVTNAIAVQW